MDNRNEADIRRAIMLSCLKTVEGQKEAQPTMNIRSVVVNTTLKNDIPPLHHFSILAEGT